MTEPMENNQELPEDDAAPALESPDARIAELEKQVAELKDRALREMADAENTRRRAAKDREDTAKYAVGNFAKEMLVVADNFQRALDATPTDNADPALKSLIEGVEATERQLMAALERFGIKKLDPQGQLFDPNFHRAMVEIPAPDQPAGTIMQVLQAGYVIHDRLLREALVAVAKGGPAPQPKIDQSA